MTPNMVHEGLRIVVSNNYAMEEKDFNVIIEDQKVSWQIVDFGYSRWLIDSWRRHPARDIILDWAGVTRYDIGSQKRLAVK